MPHHDTFVLHVWHSRTSGGQQWAARLEHLPDGRSRGFDDPDGLIAYLRGLVDPADRAAPPAGAPGADRGHGAGDAGG